MSSGVFATASPLEDAQAAVGNGLIPVAMKIAAHQKGRLAAMKGRYRLAGSDGAGCPHPRGRECPFYTVPEIVQFFQNADRVDEKTFVRTQAQEKGCGGPRNNAYCRPATYTLELLSPQEFEYSARYRTGQSRRCRYVKN